LRTALALLAVLAVALPRGALAQDAAGELPTDPRAAKFKDVERGFFVGFEAGYLDLFRTPTQNRAAFPYAGASGGAASGLLVTVLIGVDLGDRLSLSLVGLGANQSASLNYGSFALFGGGLDLHYAYFATRDTNDDERFFAFVHGRMAYAASAPAGLFGDREVIAAAGPGVEYFTRLRHFSVGLAGDLVYAAPAHTAGFAIYPTIRYTF